MPFNIHSNVIIVLFLVSAKENILLFIVPLRSLAARYWADESNESDPDL